MARDSRVVFYGEDVADYGGLQGHQGLLEASGATASSTRPSARLHLRTAAARR